MCDSNDDDGDDVMTSYARLDERSWTPQDNTKPLPPRAYMDRRLGLNPPTENE
jgi:hypothetical protein